MAVRLLALGDLHLGRVPRRLAPQLGSSSRESSGSGSSGSGSSGSGFSVEDLTPEVGLRRAVDEALRRDVDAVLFAGDLVESPEDRFRALAPLEVACERLAEAGIAALAVAGNHDVHALPSLVGRLEARGVGKLGVGTLGVLGRGGGGWEARIIEGRNGTRVRIVGRSFRELRETCDPLRDFDGASLPGAELLTVGLLHCDVDRPESPYAPVRRAAFDEGPAAACQAWLLGHIHRPDELRGPRPVGYLGSVVALDSGERGARGPWLVEVDSTGAVQTEHLPLSPVRYETLTVDCGELVDLGSQRLDSVGFDAVEGGSPSGRPAAHVDAVADALSDRIRSAVHRELESVRALQPGLDVLVVRVALCGAAATPTVRDAVRQFDEPGRLPAVTSGGAVALVERIDDRLTPPVEREQLALERGPLGELARLVGTLEAAGPAAAELAREFDEQHLATALRQGPWAGRLGGSEHEGPDPAAAELLLEVARELLAELHADRVSRSAVASSSVAP